MRYLRNICLLTMVFTTPAFAVTDPMANCPSVMSENDFEAAGGKLITTATANLYTFPHGFLRDCNGEIDLHGLVKTDGSVAILGSDHGVLCGSGSNPKTGFDSAMWRTAVVTQRFVAQRFRPPLMAGKAICVRIERGWIAESPHKFWRPEDWKKYKGWK